MNDRGNHDRYRFGLDTSWFRKAFQAKTRELPSQLLVIEWKGHCASIAVYRQTSGTSKRQSEFRVDWSAQGPNNPEEIGERIATELNARGISIRDAIVSIPRRNVVLKDLTLPKALASDLTEAVRLQCQTLFPVSAETLVLDYVVSPLSYDENAQTILIAAAPRDLIELIIDAMRHAKLQSFGIGFAEHGYTRLLPGKRTDDWQIHVVVNASSSNFVLSYLSFPVITYTGRTPESYSDRVQYLSSTISRLCHAAKQRYPEMGVPSVRVFGDVEQALELNLAEQLPNSVRVELTPESTDLHDRALIASFESQSYSLNFFSPRKPYDIKAAGRKRYAIIGLVLFACVAGIGLFSYLRHGELDRQLAVALEERTKLEAQLERKKSLETTWRKLSEFERSRFDFASELQDVLNRMKQPEKMYVLAVDVSSGQENTSPTLKLKGKVKDRETFAALTDELLLSSGRYRLRPPLLEPTTGDLQYSFSFTFELELKS